MAEWLIVTVSKIVLALANEGSNPSFSVSEVASQMI
jgi:hypothetical protein